MLPKVVAIVRDFLGKVNTESGKTENRFNLVQLDQQLIFRPGEEVVSDLSIFIVQMSCFAEMSCIVPVGFAVEGGGPRVDL